MKMLSQYLFNLAQQLLDRVEGVLYPRQRHADRGSEIRTFSTSVSKWQKFWRIGSALGSVLLLCAFVYAVQYYSTTRLRIEQNSKVINLTKSEFKARIGIVSAEDCDKSTCATAVDFSDKEWDEYILPLKAGVGVQGVRGFDKNKPNLWVYYRLHLNVPPSLLQTQDELSLTPMYINHRQFYVYLNGVLTQSGNGSFGNNVNISIPRHYIADGNVLLVIAAPITPWVPSEIGIAHRGAVYLGPKPVLDNIYVHAERAMGSYYLLFLLSKGSIFIVFSLFYLFTKGQRGLFKFLIFAYFVTLENLFLGDFLSYYLTPWSLVIGYAICKIIATCGLMAFFVDYFQVHRQRHAMLYTMMPVLLVGLLSLLGFGIGWVQVNHLLTITNWLLVITIIMGAGIGGVMLRLWRKVGVPAANIASMRNFVIFALVYGGFLVWEFGFNKFVGFDKRAVFDLFFFYYIAFISAREYGFKEDQVHTLEKHMIEKRRMERELQEAAEIAKAFLPGSIPEWKRIKVAAFHKSLTENSGDWYAFERSHNKELYHFVLCDITGHGVQGAIVVSTCRAILSFLMEANPDSLDQNDFLTRYAKALNHALYSQGSGYHTATFLGITFDAETHTVYYTSAGHPPPLYIAKPNIAAGKITPLISRHSSLGLKPEADLKLSHVKFEQGDQIFAYTDGFPVMSNIKHFTRILQNQSANLERMTPFDLYQEMRKAELERNAQAPADDVSLVWFKAG